MAIPLQSTPQSLADDATAGPATEDMSAAVQPPLPPKPIACWYDPAPASQESKSVAAALRLTAAISNKPSFEELLARTRPRRRHRTRYTVSAPACGPAAHRSRGRLRLGDCPRPNQDCLDGRR
jgi:hypothetical protein